MKHVLQLIDSLSEWVGKIISWLILALTGVLVIEVVARYFLKSPTTFAFDLTWMLFGIYIILGAAYTHMMGGNVRIDMFYNLLPKRKRAFWEIILYLIFFFPLIFVLSVSCTDFAINAWASDERSSTSLWRPPIYPFKMAMVIGLYLLGLQGLVQFLKKLYELVQK